MPKANPWTIIHSKEKRIAELLQTNRDLDKALREVGDILILERDMGPPCNALLDALAIIDSTIGPPKVDR